MTMKADFSAVKVASPKCSSSFSSILGSSKVLGVQIVSILKHGAVSCSVTDVGENGPFPRSAFCFLHQVYLRNLGIDQSPSSILTPFIPRGPIREIEFSPSELRTSKASHDVLLQPLQSSEGKRENVTVSYYGGHQMC